MTAEQALDAIIEDDELNKIIAGFITHHLEYNSIERMNLPEQEIKHRCEIEKIKREKLLEEMQESWENHTRQELDRLEKELKIIKDGGGQLEESYKNKSYDELYEIIKNEFKYKKRIYGGIKAVFCTTEDDFNLVKYFFRCAHSPCCCHYGLTKVDGCYSGPDWYFCEHQDFDYGMGAKSTTYWMESLSDKKQRFEKFVAEYE